MAVDINRGRAGAAPVRKAAATPAKAAPKRDIAPTPSLSGRQAAIPGGTPSGVGVRRAPAPVRTAAPAPFPQPVSDFYAGDTYGGYSGGGAMPAMSEGDYLGGDTAYQATLAALDAALKQYETDVEAQKKKYDVDYETSLNTLGWRRPVGTEGAADYKPGDWNLTDANTASGKAYQSQLGDFASRGILQSSLYDRARNDLMDQLNKQLTSVNTARTNFMDDLNRQLTGFRTEDTQKRQQARAESIANMAGSLGI